MFDSYERELYSAYLILIINFFSITFNIVIISHDNDQSLYRHHHDHYQDESFPYHLLQHYQHHLDRHCHNDILTFIIIIVIASAIGITHHRHCQKNHRNHYHLSSS